MKEKEKEGGPLYTQHREDRYIHIYAGILYYTASDDEGQVPLGSILARHDTLLLLELIVWVPDSSFLAHCLLLLDSEAVSHFLHLLEATLKKCEPQIS